MRERIVKNKRKSLCSDCNKFITTDYKVKYKRNLSEKKYRYFHLICYYKSIIRMIKNYKEILSEHRKSKRKLSRYKKHMILEGLENPAEI